jgi:hypothetical protein
LTPWGRISEGDTATGGVGQPSFASERQQENARASPDFHENSSPIGKRNAQPQFNHHMSDEWDNRDITTNNDEQRQFADGDVRSADLKQISDQPFRKLGLCEVVNSDDSVSEQLHGGRQDGCDQANVLYLDRSREELHRLKRLRDLLAVKTSNGPHGLYRKAAMMLSMKTKKPCRKLVVLELDLTFIFLDRKLLLRPHFGEFLDFLFENFYVMIWSFTSPDTLKDRVESVIPYKYRKHLLAVWDYRLGHAGIKDLRVVWHGLRTNGLWDQSNTVIIESMSSTTVLQPYNAIHLPAFIPGRQTDKGLRLVIDYLTRLLYESNISNYIKERPFKADKMLTC